MRSLAIAGADFGGFVGGVVGVYGLATIAGAATGGTGAVVVMGVAGLMCGAGASYAAWATVPLSIDNCANAYTSCLAVDETETSLDAEETEYFFRPSKRDLILVPNPGDEGEVTEYMLAPVPIDLPVRYEYMNDYGVLHNNMLMRLNTDVDIACDVDPALMEFVSTNEYQQFYNKITDNVLAMQLNGETADYDALLATAVEFGMSQTVCDVFKLFLDAFLHYPQDMSDVQLLINEYIKIIEPASDLTEKDKEVIYAGFAMAANSAKYWSMYAK